MILLTALAPLLEPNLGTVGMAAVILPLQALALGVALFVRQRVVKPRIGDVRLRPQRVRKLRKFNYGMLIAGIVALAIFILFFMKADNLPEGLQNMQAALIFALLALIPFSIAGFFFGLPRLYIYGVLVALSPLASDWLSSYWAANFTNTLAVAAAIVILTGFVIFIRFLQSNPLPVDEMAS